MSWISTWLPKNRELVLWFIASTDRNHSRIPFWKCHRQLQKLSILKRNFFLISFEYFLTYDVWPNNCVYSFEKMNKMTNKNIYFEKVSLDFAIIVVAAVYVLPVGRLLATDKKLKWTKKKNIIILCVKNSMRVSSSCYIQIYILNKRSMSYILFRLFRIIGISVIQKWNRPHFIW